MQFGQPEWSSAFYIRDWTSLGLWIVLYGTKVSLLWHEIDDACGFDISRSDARIQCVARIAYNLSIMIECNLRLLLFCCACRETCLGV